ncbi:MAG: cryptochrome/photolyase family protein [Thermoguttaceae bacterium]
MTDKQAPPLRHLVIVLGDQLDLESAAFDGFDADRDAVWMAEVAEEATHVWSHKARIALFLSAMRHFRDALRKRGWTVLYRELEDLSNQGSFAGETVGVVRQRCPIKLVVVEPGEFRVKQDIERTAADLGVPLEIRQDRHFLCTHEDFAQHAEGRKQLRMEYFYREMRRKTGVLVEGGKPTGGEWNYDLENRQTFDASDPGNLPLPPSFSPDAVTRGVLSMVSRMFDSHPGQLDAFDWPVTREEAQSALDDFVTYRLPLFGKFQDAMWTDEPFLYHSLISSSLNMKLLHPSEAIDAAVRTFESGGAAINSVEGFVRQILGWREYIRGVYWRYMPEYQDRNLLGADLELPQFYWTGGTDMHCLYQTISQTLEYGYAHHIQRLMVTGLFALLFGVRPLAVHEWYLAVYVDAVEWVELPNTLGMSQFADGGVMASKPYVATGKYIQRMSNYCAGCRYNPSKAYGEDACPFTTLYWDFLQRHRGQLQKNQRMVMQIRNLDRKPEAELAAIRRQATAVRSQLS